MLGRFNLGEDGRLSVVASFVQEVGTGRGCTEYTLEREGDEWVIVEPPVDAWPDCSISSHGEDSYHDALERARGSACLVFGRHTGTCGPWLYIAEANGYYSEESYFDLQTGLLVAKHFSDDIGRDAFVFGEDLGCERTVTESIPCSDEDGQAIGVELIEALVEGRGADSLLRGARRLRCFPCSDVGSENAAWMLAPCP